MRLPSVFRFGRDVKEFSADGKMPSITQCITIDSITEVNIFTAQRYASTVVVSVRLSVRHKPALYQVS